MSNIAEGTIQITLADRDAIAGLHKTKAEFDKTMREIGHTKAEAEIDAKITPLEQKIEKAKRGLKKLEAEGAKVSIGADAGKFDAKIAMVKRQIKMLEGHKATIQIEVENDKRALASIQKVAAANDRMNAAQLRHADQVERVRRKMLVAGAQEEAQAKRLEQQYARLTDKIERLDKTRRRTIGREERAKIDLDAAGAYADIEKIKAVLNVMGRKPPVGIKVDLDKRGLARVQQTFGNFLGMIGRKAGGLGDIAVRLGPFTASIRQLGAVMSVLGPTITDIAGAATSLVGVLGAGIAGAAAVGAAGIAGMGIGFLGLKFAMRDTGQETAQARLSINALQAAQLKYGKGSDQAAKKQKELNSVLRQISPLAKQSALGIESFFRIWDKNTHPTQNNLGNIAKNGFDALKAITPMWANETNKLSGTLDRNLRGGFAFLKSTEFRNSFKDIAGNFTDSLTPALHGLGSLGRVVLRILASASKLLPGMAQGFQRWADALERAVQPGEKLDGQMRSLGHRAQEVGSFFMALGRILVTVFGGATPAGANMLDNMTAALNRWNSQLQTMEGQKGLHTFFGQAAKGATQLYHALAPVVVQFVKWSSNLSPIFTLLVGGLLQAGRGVALVARGFASLLNIIPGMNSGVQTFAATLGGLYAVGKIGASIAGIARMATEVKRLKTEGGLLKSIFTGGLLKEGLKGGGLPAEMKTGGAFAGAEIATAMEGAGGVVAAEIAAALRSGGAVAGAEGALGGLLGPTGKPISRAGGAAAGAATKVEGAAAKEAAKDVGKFAAANLAVRGVLTGLAADSALATGGLTLLAGAAGYGVYKLLTMKDATDKLKDSIKESGKTASTLKDSTSALSDVMYAAGGAASNYHDAVHNVNTVKARLNKLEAEGKKGTQEYKDTLSQLQPALDARAAAWRTQNQLQTAGEKLMAKQRDATAKLAPAEDALHKAIDARNKAQKDATNSVNSEEPGKHARDLAKLAQAEGLVKDASSKRAAIQAQINRMMRDATIAQAVYIRGQQHMPKLTAPAAAALGKVGQRSPKLAMEIALKYPDPGDVAKVAQAINRSLKGGAKIDKIKLAVEKGGNVESIIARLKKLIKIPDPKKPKLGADAGPAITAAGKAIKSIHLFGAQNPRRIPLYAQNSTGAAIASASAALSSFLSRWGKGVTIPIRASGGIGGAKGGAKLSGVKAAGGPSNVAGLSGAENGMDKRNAERLALKQLDNPSPFSPTKGERVDTPRYVAGDTTHPEYIVSTHPAYRKRNKGILSSAANALGGGVKFFAAGSAGSFAGDGKFYANTAAPTEKGLPTVQSAKTLLGSKKYNTPRKKTVKAMKTRRAWGDYVDQLGVRQGALEQEVDIRQAAVREPEDLVVKSGTTPVKDPITGKTVDVDHFVANPKIESEWKPDLDKVKQAMVALMAVVGELVRAIPQAIAANRQERQVRTSEIGTLNTEIKKEQNRKGLKGDAKDKSEKRIKKLTDKRDEYKQVNSDLREDETTLHDKRVTAGFDLREEQQGLTDLQHDYDTANGAKDTATADSAQAVSDVSDNSSSTGSDGGASATLSYDQQSAIADSQKAQVFKDYGGNANPNVGGQTGPSSPGLLVGQQVNAALLGGAGAMGAFAATSGASGMAAGLSGGQAAGGMMAARSASGPAGFAAASPTPAGGAGNTVTVNNNYAAPPPDPHTWSKGVAFELAATV